MAKFVSKKRGTRKRGRKRKASSPKTAIMDIPEHLLMIILRKCPPATLLQASAVCKQFHSLCTSDTLWKPLYEELHFTVGLISTGSGSGNEKGFVHTISGLLHRPSEREDSEGANTHYDLSRLNHTRPFMEEYKHVVKNFTSTSRMIIGCMQNPGRINRPSYSPPIGIRIIPYSSLRGKSVFHAELIFLQTFEKIFGSSACKARGRVPVRKGYREHEVVDAAHLAKVRKLRNPWLTLARRNR